MTWLRKPGLNYSIELQICRQVGHFFVDPVGQQHVTRLQLSCIFILHRLWSRKTSCLLGHLVADAMAIMVSINMVSSVLLILTSLLSVKRFFT